MIRTDLYPTGRKHCSRCGCWRYLHEFGRNKDWLQARCKTCERLIKREQGGHKPRQFRRIPRRGTPEYRAYRRELYHRNGGYAAWPEKKKANRREYARFYKEAKRRERGAYVRNTRPDCKPDNGKPPHREGERLALPAGPLVDWVRENVPHEGQTAIAQKLGVDETTIRRLREGRQRTVHIDVVDRLCVRAGLHLSDLYPELYE